MYNWPQDFLECDTMGYHRLPCERDQLYLMPPALQDWLPEGDLAWFILDAVAQMNLTAIERHKGLWNLYFCSWEEAIT
jgi:hypothetical protein